MGPAEAAMIAARHSGAPVAPFRKWRATLPITRRMQGSVAATRACHLMLRRSMTCHLLRRPLCDFCWRWFSSVQFKDTLSMMVRASKKCSGFKNEPSKWVPGKSRRNGGKYYCFLVCVLYEYIFIVWIFCYNWTALKATRLVGADANI